MFLKIESRDLIPINTQNNELVHTLILINLKSFCSFLFFDKVNAVDMVGLEESTGFKFFFKDLETYEKYKNKILMTLQFI
jgi:hypothetical protein